ncbi:MAG: cytochrome c3 family protein, partial [Acidobacteria bacterium]|nr:cytochrome c3 family protein [Acidobacteriota bacterium]
MAQLFHRGANNIAKASMAMAIVLAGVAFFVYSYAARSSYITGQYLEKQQPVQFSHRHHVGDDGIDCRYCHSTVETSASAGVPPTQTCMNCHNQ